MWFKVFGKVDFIYLILLGGDLELWLFKILEVLNCCLVLFFDDKCFCILFVNFWENVVVLILFGWFLVVGDVGEWMGLSLLYVCWSGFVGLSMILGVFVFCFSFGLFGFELDFWWFICKGNRKGIL